MENLRLFFHKQGIEIVKTLGIIFNPFLLNFKNEKNQLLVFCFHGLFESAKQNKLNHIDPQNNMTVAQFTDFIKYFLNHRYKFIIPEDLEKGLEPGQSYAMITFDDGYFNNMLAFNVLRELNVPALFFITTRNVKENRSYWWDIIYKYRIKQGSMIKNIRDEQCFLKSHKHDYIEDYIIKNFGIDSFTPWSDIDRPFTVEELRNLSLSPLVSIGNHTHNHEILTNCNRDEIVAELSQSNKILTDITGRFPISAAYPNGDYNNTIMDIMIETGFRYTVSTRQKSNLLPFEQKKLICMDRYMTRTSGITTYGSFCRMGYEPDMLYNGLRERIKTMIPRKNQPIHINVRNL